MLLVTPTSVAAACARDLRCTVDGQRRGPDAELLDLGVAGIITDFPNRLLRIMAER